MATVGLLASVNLEVRLARIKNPQLVEGRDPETGDRLLERLAFEILSSERRAHAGRKAALLRARGVHRVFAIDVVRSRAFEWDAEVADWRILPDDAAIEDVSLAVPIRVADLVSAARVDDVLARALIAKRNPVFEATFDRRTRAARRRGRQEGRKEGRLERTREILIQAILARGAALEPPLAERIAEATQAELDEWLARVLAGEVPESLQ